MENKPLLQETCEMILSFLGTKTLKRVRSILYEQTEQQYQKTCVLSIFHLVRYQNSEMYGKHVK